MVNAVVTDAIPPGAAIRVGVPNDRPSEALQVLKTHFAKRPAVQKAQLGLMQIVDANGNGPFRFTIGIHCFNPADREAEERLAINEVLKVALGRWPIAFFPPNGMYFSQQAEVFYEHSGDHRTPI